MPLTLSNFTRLESLVLELPIFLDCGNSLEYGLVKDWSGATEWAQDWSTSPRWPGRAAICEWRER
jgi:hypothetical protein